MWQKIKLIKSLDLGHFHWSIRYGAAAGFVFCALLLNYLPPVRTLPFLFFFAAVALAARVCGFGPALFATALSAALAEYFLILPRFIFFHPATDLLRLLLFALVCLVISSIARQKSKAEKIAEENRSRLAAIVESSEDAIFSKTLEGAITSWNRSAQKLYGYTPSEIIHRNVKVLAAADKEEEIDDILRKLSRGERIEHYETQRVTKSGAKVDVSLSISPLFDLEGKIIGAATIARDITARKLSEEVLLKTEKLVAAGRLAATIAHEINNPLEAATNLLYLLGRNRSLDERARNHLALAEHELERVAHMSRQTLGFYRDSSSPMTVEVTKVLDEVLGLYGRKLQAKAIAVQKEYSAQLRITAFAGEVRQVFSNLVANSIDAIPGPGSLKLRVTRSRGWQDSNLPGVRITIADSGSGISPEQRHKLFEPFYTTKKDVGTGLGLWLSREIVKKHQGSIQVRSSIRSGQTGTVFSVFFPAGAAAEADDQQEHFLKHRESA